MNTVDFHYRGVIVNQSTINNAVYETQWKVADLRAFSPSHSCLLRLEAGAKLPRAATEQAGRGCERPSPGGAAGAGTAAAPAPPLPGERCPKASHLYVRPMAYTRQRAQELPILKRICPGILLKVFSSR